MSKTVPPPNEKARGNNAEQREESTRRILETAIRHIAQRGASKLSLVDVGREAGYSHSLPTYYFKTKRRLVLEVCRSIIGGFRERSGNWIRENIGRPVQPGLDSIEATIRAYLGLASQQGSSSVRALHVLWAEACSSMPELLEVVRPFNERSIEAFAEQLRTGIRRGEIDPSVDVETLAPVILGMLRGALAQHLLDPQRVDLDRVAGTMVAMLRRGVSCRHAAGAPGTLLPDQSGMPLPDRAGARAAAADPAPSAFAPARTQ